MYASWKEQHGVDLGLQYINDHACATLIEFIARDKREQLGADKTCVWTNLV